MIRRRKQDQMLPLGRRHPSVGSLAAALIVVLATSASLVLLATSASIVNAQAPGGRQGKPTVRQPHPIRLTMEELHEQGGVPRRWKFLLPPGDPVAGRRVFVAMECFACHTVADEEFPSQTRIAPGPGPDLTGMGAHHPTEYFAESIMHPNRVIVLGPGYTGWDSLSKMPSYADVMTVKQLIDVVAYLKSLTEEPSPDHDHTGHDHTTHQADGLKRAR
jgi:mono/diheme cytochrome c family protein